MYSFVFRCWPPIQCFSVYIVFVRLFSSLAASPAVCVSVCCFFFFFFQLLSSIRFGSFGIVGVLLLFCFLSFNFLFSIFVFLCKFSFWSVSLFIEFGNGSERWFVGAACAHTFSTLPLRRNFLIVSSAYLRICRSEHRQGRLFVIFFHLISGLIVSLSHATPDRFVWINFISFTTSTCLQQSPRILLVNTSY